MTLQIGLLGAVSSSTGAVAAGDTIVRAVVPAGATAIARKNGANLGAATVTAQGAASYTLGTAAAAGEVYDFAWTLAGTSPSASVLASLGPSAASFAVGAASGSLITAISGLSAGETLSSVAPNDGRVAINGGGNALLVGLTASSVGTISYTVTTSAGRTLTVAVTTNAAGAYRSITGQTQLPSALVANSNSSVQMQTQQHYKVLRSSSTVVLTVGNFSRSGPNGPITVQNIAKTIRSIYVSKSATSGFVRATYQGAGSFTLAPGQKLDLDPVALPVVGGPGTSGDSLFVREDAVWASAPTSWPNNKVIASGNYDFNRQSTDGSLADLSTLTGSAFPAVRTLTAGCLQSVLLVKGLASGPVVWLPNDSIGSDAASDTAFPVFYGYTQNGLAKAGIPTVNTGISAQGLFGLSRNTPWTEYLSQALSAGATHALVTCLGADFTSNRTGAQSYQDLLDLKALLDTNGIKLVPITTTPKTNTANTGMNGSETVTDVQQPDLNSRIRAGNGAGYGYIEIHNEVGQAGVNRWRTDLLKASAVAVASGGTGYAVGDDVDLPGGLQVRVTSVSAGVATGLSIRKAGGFKTAPSAALAQEFANRGGLNTAGTGLTVTVTTTATSVIADSADGIHPSGVGHGILADAVRAAAPTLFV